MLFADSLASPPFSSSDEIAASAAFLFWCSMARKKIVLVEEPTDTCKQCKSVCFGESIQCRLNPPECAFDSEGVHVDSCWPIVHADDWCSEFKPKLAS